MNALKKNVEKEDTLKKIFRIRHQKNVKTIVLKILKCLYDFKIL